MSKRKRDEPEVEGSMSSDGQVNALAERVGQDDAFAARLDTDPITTLRAEGFGELAKEAEREAERFAQLVQQLEDDGEFRARVEAEPGELVEWGVPEPALEPVLAALGAPDDVLERASADVEAHASARQVSATAAIVVLGAFAFASQASAASQPERYRWGSAAQPDKGRLAAQPDKGRLVAQPDRGRLVAQPDKGRLVTQPDRGRLVAQPDKGRLAAQGDKRSASGFLRGAKAHV